MGIIKTAMMSGAAMYGINKLAQTAQTRGNNNSSNRAQYDRDGAYYSRGPSDRGDPYSGRTVEYREYRPEVRGSAGRDAASRDQGPGCTNERGNYLYLEDDYAYQGQPYYMDNRVCDQGQYAYTGQARSPPQQKSSHNSQRGFVEPEEIMDDVREPQRGSRADMMNALAQQAMGVGLFGGDDQKNKGKKGDMLKSLIGK
jgi:hypothetical protein